MARDKHTEKKPHRIRWSKVSGKHRCEKCGTLQLKNERTERALKRSCDETLWTEEDAK